MKKNDTSFIIAFAAIVFFSNSLFAQVTFTDVTLASKITAPPSGPSYNSMWIDIDNDDYLDLYIARGIQSEHLQTQLFRNLKDGTFQDLSPTAFGNRQPAYNAQGCWGDYDNDGFIDLLENHFDGSDNKLWHNEGNLTFTDKSSLMINTGWQATGAVWSDFDTDGFVDLFVHTQAGAGTFEEKNIGGKQFQKVNLFQNNGQGHLLLSPDLNLDGVPDFYMGNINSPDQCFISSDSGYTPFDISMISVSSNRSDWMTAAFADINNDGYPDLLYIQNTRFFLLQNDSGKRFIDITSASGLDLPPVSLATGAYRSSYIQDIDNDGYLDIILLELSGRTTIWYGSPSGFKKTVLPLPEQPDIQSVLSWTDYDNDGFIDLLVVTPAFTHLYHNDGNGNRWLNVKLRGHKANSQGIGARVIAYSEGKVQYREIGYTQSTLGYSPLMAHFGFGPIGCDAGSAVMDSVVVIWHPGGRQVIKNVRYNELAVIDQDSGIVRTIQKPVSVSSGYADPLFPAPKSVYANTIVSMPMTVRMPNTIVKQSIIPDEISFGVEYNSDIIDISPSNVSIRYTPPIGWTYKSSVKTKDSLFITITNSSGSVIGDSLSLGTLQFDTYNAKPRGTYLFLYALDFSVNGNDYKFCHNFEGDFLGEVLIIDHAANVPTDDQSTSLSLTVLPNPSSGNFVTLRCSVGQALLPVPAEIKIFDVLGKEVYRYNGKGNKAQTGICNFAIPTAQLGGGTYLVKLNMSRQVLTGKFTVVK
jgi:hypothetical protein